MMDERLQSNTVYQVLATLPQLVLAELALFLTVSIREIIKCTTALHYIQTIWMITYILLSILTLFKE